MPKRTADLAGVLRITASRRSSTHPEHLFVLDNGDRVPAKQLALGTALAPTPPVEYPGIDPGDPAAANVAGFVYGYALVMMGANAVPRAPRRQVPKVPIARSVTPEALQLLGYDRAAAVRAPDIDHDRIAAVQIPEPHQKVRPPPLTAIFIRSGGRGSPGS